MTYRSLERLFECIGKIEDSFLTEAETVNISKVRSDKRKRIAKYSAYGAAGLVISVGIVAACLKLRSNRLAKSA